MINIPFIGLLSNPSKMQNINQASQASQAANEVNEAKEVKEIKNDVKEINIVCDDDNDEILRLLRARLNLGKDRYGHGMIVDDDTTKYGTLNNDWHLMAEEEILDGLIYAAASIIRYRRKQAMISKKKTMDDFDLRY